MCLHKTWTLAHLQRDDMYPLLTQEINPTASVITSVLVISICWLFSMTGLESLFAFLFHVQFLVCYTYVWLFAFCLLIFPHNVHY